MSVHYDKLDEVIEFNGEKFIVIENKDAFNCEGCALADICIPEDGESNDWGEEYFKCVDIEREDRKNIKYKKVEQ